MCRKNDKYRAENEFLKLLNTEYHWGNIFENNNECEHDNVGKYWGKNI